MTLIRRAHPFTVGAVALALSALALVLPNPVETTALYLITGLLALLSGAGRAVWRGLIVVAPIWILLFLLQVVWGEGPRVAAPWVGTLSHPGLLWAWSQGTRLAVIVTASLVFALSFHPHRFLQAAIQRRWPFKAAFVLVATLDAADRLLLQARRLREAQRTRGVRVTGSMATRARALPALIFPLLLASLTEADDRALALETRGLLMAGPRYATDPPRDSLTDQAVRWLALAAVVVAAALRLRH
ncbi:MAG: energy-coupling factor transporter transmembrane component T [Gemmatimonadales bacterium]